MPIRTLAAAAMLTAAALPASDPADARPTRTVDAACSRAKARFHASSGFPPGRIAFCDFLSRSDSPRGFYVLALHSTRRCDAICSTNLGWFAVERRSGRVYVWNVAEARLGRPLP